MKELVVHTFVFSLAEFDVTNMVCEVEGRKEPNSDCAVPIPKELLSNSQFTESEILLQQLACKLACTEFELAQQIDLLESPRFHQAKLVWTQQER